MTSFAKPLLVVLVFLGACGGGGADRQSPAQRGEGLYTQLGCASCHSVDGSRLVGPTWRGLYGSEVRLADGSATIADEDYLRESILQPTAKTVEGFPQGLMETVIKPNSLTSGEVEALVAYIRTLR